MILFKMHLVDPETLLMIIWQLSVKLFNVYTVKILKAFHG